MFCICKHSEMVMHQNFLFNSKKKKLFGQCLQGNKYANLFFLSMHWYMNLACKTGSRLQTSKSSSGEVSFFSYIALNCNILYKAVLTFEKIFLLLQSKIIKDDRNCTWKL